MADELTDNHIDEIVKTMGPRYARLDRQSRTALKDQINSLWGERAISTPAIPR